MIGWKPNLLWFVCFIFTTQNASAHQGSSVTTSCPLASLQELMKQSDSSMTHFTPIIPNSKFWDEKSQLTPLYLFCTFLLHPPSPPDDLRSAPLTWAQWTAWESGEQRFSGHRLSAVLRDYLLTPVIHRGTWRTRMTSSRSKTESVRVLGQDRYDSIGTNTIRSILSIFFSGLIIFIKLLFLGSSACKT